MDILSHFLLGIVVFHKNSKYTLLLGLFSILPDILGTIPNYIYYFLQFKKQKKYTLSHFISRVMKRKPRNKNVQLYNTTHNLFSSLLLFLVFYIFSPKHMVFSICYFLHVLVDVLTHKGWWAPRIFYPFSSFHLDVISWWEHPKLILATWFILFAILGFVL